MADGYDNSRVAKFTKDGDFVKSIGSRGTAPDQFNTPHAITYDNKGLIYVGDRGNSRIQVYDGDLNRKAIFSNVRAPWAVCVTPPNAKGEQFLYSADAGGKIYKLSLDGKLLGAEGYDFYNPAEVVTTGELNGGRHELDVGEHRLEIKILAPNPAATPRNMFGLDYVKLERK